jgi:hypothetical protein
MMTALMDPSVSMMTALRRTNEMLSEMEQLLEQQYSYLLSSWENWGAQADRPGCTMDWQQRYPRTTQLTE